MFKSKKADLPITLLVVMILILCLIASFTFLTKQNSYERNMQQVRVIPATYAGEEAFILYLHSLAQSIIKENPTIDEKNFIIKFQNQYSKENVPEYNSSIIKNQIMNSSKYAVEIKDKKLSFKLRNFEFSRNFYYDPGTTTYLFDYFELSKTPRQEAVRVKHTQDIVFQI